MKYLVYGPGYSESSGGIIVLHKLCSMLTEIGEDSDYFVMNQVNQNVSYDPDKDVVIYPEVIKGNPLGFKRIVRWALNHGSHNLKNFKKDNLVFYYSKFFRDYIFDMDCNELIKSQNNDVNNILQVLVPNESKFIDYGAKRKGSVFMCHKAIEKGYNIGLPEKDSIQIRNNMNMNSLVKIFNSVERFYTYDTVTYYSVIAVLCGATSIVIPEKNLTKDEWRNKVWGMKYGIAYGVDDIEYAEETKSLVRSHIIELGKSSIDSVRNFIKVSKNYWQYA